MSLYLLANKLKDIATLHQFKINRIIGSLKESHTKIALLHTYVDIVKSLLSGTAVLKLAKADFTVAAADLNAAETGTFKKKFGLAVETLKGRRAILLENIAPTFTPAESVADVDVVAPSIVGTPKLDKGFVQAEITFDTGATKTYAADDEVSVACDLTIAGIALVQVTATWTVV